MKKYLYVAILLFSSVACVEKDYFGELQEADVLTFEIDKQISCVIKPYVDYKDTGLVSVLMPAGTDLSDLKVNYITFSVLAHPSKDITAVTDFTEPVVLSVIAEDNFIQKVWKIEVACEDPEDPENPTERQQQLEFASMTTWTNALDNNGSIIKLSSGELAYSPGDGTGVSPWSTTAEANAFSLSQINFFTTQPKPGYSNAQYARMETLEVDVPYMKNLGTAVVAGALFTGKFQFEVKYGMPNNGGPYPRKMLDFGTSFRSKPKSVTFKMRYAPGVNMKDGELNLIVPSATETRATKDSCDIYFILQNRNGGDYIRVGAAWLRTSETIGNINDDAGGFVEQTLEFVYGKPSAEQLRAKPYMKLGGTRGELTFYQFPLTATSVPVEERFAMDPDNTDVTHLIVMFSSSAYGDKFWAASNPAGSLTKGSTLDIKEVVFNY